jgi:hypothetical protein
LATNAENSPKECPATISAPRPFTAFKAATECIKIEGWVTSVF